MQEAGQAVHGRNGADFSFSTADVSLLHTDMAADGQAIISSDHPLLDLCVTPRPANMRGAFTESWGSHRFETLGDIIFVPPSHPLHLRWDGGGEQYSIRCALRGKLARHRFRTQMDWTDARLLASLDISSHPVRLLLRRLAEEARSPRRDTRLLVGAVATQLTVEICRYLECVTDDMAHGGLAAWRLRLIDERLNKETTPPTLVELAELCSISVRQLTRGFLKSRGCTLGQYVHQNRIDAVKRLLATQESIKSVADAVGFSSTSSLAQAFRRSTGLTPRSYQQRIWRSIGSG
ncbi:AraC family transcriptional regulator [Sphingobium sp. BYY-5]|uniref:AraC family transcriptional regulator n=1 Tax=Sphingobium sp. BYY-5 TaxID=2926400 RepID=UPI001FA79ED5|nr:AraC family transcriptional regulator [Sphingobium sp. BYY-5]MCI4592100.1 AraC family transcriptional regulator [Sphingobium sp. BYY-5]